MRWTQSQNGPEHRIRWCSRPAQAIAHHRRASSAIEYSDDNHDVFDEAIIDREREPFRQRAMETVDLPMNAAVQHECVDVGHEAVKKIGAHAGLKLFVKIETR